MKTALFVRRGMKNAGKAQRVRFPRGLAYKKASLNGELSFYAAAFLFFA